MKNALCLRLAAIVTILAFPAGATAQLARNTNYSRRAGSAIAGGSGNVILSNTVCAFVGGGQQNSATAQWATVGGGAGNKSGDLLAGGAATVGGGYNNTASGERATVAGGCTNTASGAAAAVGGGTANTVGGSNAVVSGGRLNNASGPYSAVGGGYQNSNGTWYSTIAGGYFNSCSNSDYGTVGGGMSNLASGFIATVPGGSRCKATNAGCFVWSGDANADTGSFGDYTFTARATGGVRFYTASGTNTGAWLKATETSWSSVSDSNAKTKINPINPRDILSKVAAMPVTEWEYKSAPNRRYIGPMAQDFHAAFGLGSDDKSITTLDSDGVMYAAIQGLVEELKDRDKAMAARDKTIGELKAKLQAVEERLNSLPPAP